MEEKASLKNLPSFNESISTVHLDRSVEEEDDDVSDFSFVISSSDWHNDKIPSITADELFSHGKILPLYPVFGKSNSFKNGISRKEIDISDTASVSHPEPEASSEFCDWVPKSTPASPERCRKSRSTGSTRKWLLHDFLLGARSRSNGKEKFVFLTNDNKKKEQERKAKEMDMAKMHKIFYGNNGEKKKKEKETGKRRSYLPYVGFFGGGLNEGFTRTSYPF